MGYVIPAAETSEGGILLQFGMDRGDPRFDVVVMPRDADARVISKEPQLAAASIVLLKAGFDQNADVWWNGHPSHEYLDHDDVPSRLLELVERDMRVVADSDILLADIGTTGRHR